MRWPVDPGPRFQLARDALSKCNYVLDLFPPVLE